MGILKNFSQFDPASEHLSEEIYYMYRFAACILTNSELKTLEWWISRSMLDLLVLLNQRFC